MKKLIILMLILLVGKFSFGQYPINQSIGSDSTLVTSKGGLKGRIVVYSYADTTAANLERIRQYAGAMIFTTGANKLWYRNAAASAWVELGSSSGGVNIYNSDGTIDGPRNINGGGFDISWGNFGDWSSSVGAFTVSQGATNAFSMEGDTSFFSRRVSYATNLGSTFTRHTLVDKNYVDSLQNIIPTLQQVLTAGSVLTTDNEIDASGYLFVIKTNDLELQDANGDRRWLQGVGGTQIYSNSSGGGFSTLDLRVDSIISNKKIVYSGNINGTLTTPNALVTRSLVDSLISAGGGGGSGALSDTAAAIRSDFPNTYADLTTSIVDEEGFYNGFPWPVQKGDTTIVFLKHSTTHSDTGSMRFYKSWNGGRSWNSGADVYIGGRRIPNSALQVGYYNGRIYIAWTEDTYDSVFFAYSDNGGAFWTSAGGYKYSNNWSGSPSVQEIFKIKSDTLYSAQYEVDSDSDSTRAFLLYSANNGASWSYLREVLLHTGTTSPNGKTSEWFMVETAEGLYDNTTQFAALFRNENYGYYTHVRTANLFQTKTEDVTNLMYEFGNQVQRAPVCMFNMQQTIYILCGNRRVNGLYALEYVTIPAASFYTNTQSAYSKVRKLYAATAATKAAAEDFGYPLMYTYNGKPYVTMYDVSPVYHSSGEGGDDDVRSINFPLLDRGYSEKFNDANQSIPDSTQTLVSYPDLLLDCMGSWDYDGDAGTTDSVWEAKEDGWYMVNAIATFEANGTGSYRQMYVIVVDPGVNTTATNQMISKTTIPGNSSISDFNRVECNGMAYIKQGEQVKVYVKHDATSALNLLNTSRETMATVKITLIR